MNALKRLRAAAASLDRMRVELEAQNAQMLGDIIEDENRPRDYTLVLSGTDNVRHEIPLRCSRRQSRKIKIAMHAAGGDGLAVER